ncbi:MAG TPA: HAD-IIIC family phosphatase [Phycisphaerae bacterium]|nr:HAD-IIIC family phosphatase [Phycisphaerae bacterium]HOJ72411.1 HAD-IIIC family phosphatase [Phycisphaerae bacterium]HOM49927.1 HAD-IIIC family phosphatase [Phycisphaerae bacterium]HOQ86547.1 HAD-IIIC family phosphatase [Phycisphaerae bacterium]HPP26355.1 HAD-IIIC family phosphatase [Phycisphaerae bacterium]
MNVPAEAVEQLRSRAVAAADAGAVHEARRLLAELWQACPSPATAQFIVTRYQTLREQLSLTPLRVAIERTFTLEPVVPLLRAKGYLNGLDLAVRVGGFDAVASELMDPAGPLDAYQPDVVIVAVQTRSIAPDLWSRFSLLSPSQVDEAIERVSAQLHGWIRSYRSRSNAHLIVHTLDTPVFTSGGLLDVTAQLSQREAIGRINASLREVAATTPGVHLLDYDGLTARFGRLAWEDPVRWATVRMPLTAESLPHLADEWLRYLHPIAGRVAKVLVCDLDNTLWGGVLGEDGADGIAVGGDHPGASFQALQRAILDLYHRGIILAISSKNDAAEAMAVLADHPGMVLRPEHFAAVRINWNDKATSLREIAAELNVGIDALAFLDDNPHEREWIRSQLPEVWVVDLPDDPAGYERALRQQPVFERLALTDEDRRRGAMYAEQRRRRDLEQSCQTLEDYYRSLGLVVEVEEAGPDTRERAAQLLAKTNQFNLTGRRFTSQELAAMQERDDALVLITRVRDRFGDSGIVGVIVVRLQDARCHIDAFVMSCRVIGRTVETAMLAALAEQAAGRGIRALTGVFVPTARNAPARDFYARHGFARADDGVGVSSEGSADPGAEVWELDLVARPIECPEWIDLIVRLSPTVSEEACRC